MNPLRQHHHRIWVQTADIDELDHVNNTVYLRYIEEVVKAHAERVGLGFAALKQLGAIPVVRQHRITYHRPALLNQELEVSTAIVAHQSFRSTRHSEVRLAQNGVLLVEADTEWVWLEALRQRPKAPPTQVLQAFGLL